MLCKKGFLRNFKKVTRKHLCHSLFIEKETMAQKFSCDFFEISKKSFFCRTPLDDCLGLQPYWKRKASTDIFLWILWNFKEQFFIEHVWWLLLKKTIDHYLPVLHPLRVIIHLVWVGPLMMYFPWRHSTKEVHFSLCFLQLSFFCQMHKRS